ncbi:MAG: glycoside hydrolase family 13 protein [Ekhidna sp.]|nr:glycoside hydrolase family 13 protein [Ekhidna sp.]
MAHKKNLLLILAFLTLVFANAQKVDRVEPPFWWSGMVNPNLQIMLYGEDIGSLKPSLEGSEVKLASYRCLENNNYLVLDIIIGQNVQSQTVKIKLIKNGKLKEEINYEIKKRNPDYITRNSFGPSDVLYLITPDRYVNGNPENDAINGMKEKPNRSFQDGRHGGDIEGLSKSLDYIKEMGFTAIWINPVLENDMPQYSYHGYATTDFYKVDQRFGTNEQYVELVKKAHKKGIKVIMDMIVNHCGSEHWWMKDVPASDWFNYQEKNMGQENMHSEDYQITTHRKTSVQDPYIAEIDLKEFSDGWFVPTMPDLNQKNEVMAKYLIQNSIWWIEYSGIDGIRMDTYPYPDKDFMANWTCQLQDEYPTFNTVGEEWYKDPAIVAFWQQGKKNPNGYVSCLPSLMDFPLQKSISVALNEEESKWSGWVQAYATLALDFQYANPEELVVFPDNHDMNRFFTQVNEDFDLFKLGITYLLTVRGTPQIYYGTEVLMKNPNSEEHGIIRSDFPGGWNGDKVNAMTGEGLTDQQKEAQVFIKKILHWRKNQSAVHYGKLLHYNPKNGIYVLFRYNESDKVMIVLSKSKEDTTLELNRFSQLINGNESGVEILSGEEIQFNGTLEIPAMTPMVIDLD